MQQWAEIRRRVLVDGVSKRQILRETGIHWKTLEKILRHSQPPGFQAKGPRPKPKLGPFLDRIDLIRDAGYEGGYSVVRDAVRQVKRLRREAFVPLAHPPGEAQVDYGEAVARVG